MKCRYSGGFFDIFQLQKKKLSNQNIILIIIKDGKYEMNLYTYTELVKDFVLFSLSESYLAADSMPQNKRAKHTTDKIMGKNVNEVFKL